MVADHSDDDDTEDSDADEPEGSSDNEPDPDEVEEIDVDELYEEMRARREEQREQVTYEWCETIRRAGERYRELEDIETVADELSQPETDVREALTVYRLIFEEPPGKAAVIATQSGRAFFTVDTAIEEAIDLDDLDDPVEDLIREYVGAIYLEYDVDEESVGDPVENTAPELPVDLEEFRKTIADAVSVPTDALAAATAMDGLNEMIAEQVQTPTGAIAAATAMDDLNETLAQQMTIPTETMVAASGINQWQETVLQSQANVLQSAVQPMLDRQQELLQAAVSPALEQIARQHEVIAAAALESMVESFVDIQFPESVLADLAAIQPMIDAAAISTLPSVPAVGHSTVSEPSAGTAEVDPMEPSVSPDTSSVNEPMEPPVEPAVGTPVASTIDATLPDHDAVSAELVFEIPALLVETMLSTGQARAWFTSLPQDHQITVVNVMLISATLYVTGNPTLAALVPFIAPSVRRMIVEDE